MGKRLPPSLKVEAYSRLASLKSQNHPTKPQNKPTIPSNYPTKSPDSKNPRIAKTLISSRKINHKSMDGESRETRVPLSEVVNECVKRWFKDTLKEAKNGDHTMQILVGQMYNCGYGVDKDLRKVCFRESFSCNSASIAFRDAETSFDEADAWICEALKYLPWAWKLYDKRPGYNASDSDSDEPKDEK